MRALAMLALLAALAGCAPRLASSAPIEVGIIAINDFHGNLEPPKLAVEKPLGGATVAVPAGGGAYLADAIATLRRGHPQSITVSAGDMTGASPLASSVFLDEPTVAAMNLAGIDINAAGNHEFDRGGAELRRLQDGGCAKNTARTPCAIEPFAGARFRYLAGNTIRPDGSSFFPGTDLRSFGQGDRRVTIGFIGLTTRTTGTLVSPGGIRGLTFADEATTANRLVPGLKAAGADTVVLVIHEGGTPRPETDPNACEGMTGAILDIAAKLDPAISVVVSGHTHKAYVCDRPRGAAGSAPLLLTSAGRYGTLVTDITLMFDPATRRLVTRRARNTIVQSEGFTASDGTAVPVQSGLPRFAPDARVAALAGRYVAAAEPLARRFVGRVTAGMPQKPAEGTVEGPLLDLVADAQLVATRSLGAQVAFMNPAGIRAALIPATDGTVTYGDIYAVQPFGNVVMVRSFTGRQLLAVLEQQFDRASGKTMVLGVAGMTYAFDRSRPVGQRVSEARVGGTAVDPAATYRVAISNFLAFGGDEFSRFMDGTDVGDGPVDLEALEAYLGGGRAVAPPASDRITDRTPKSR